jgi:hypothetical protein
MHIDFFLQKGPSIFLDSPFILVGLFLLIHQNQFFSFNIIICF